MTRRLSFLIGIVCCIAVTAHSFQIKKPAGKAESSQLLGTWEATEEGETVRITFKSETVLELEGEEFSYSIVQGAIRLSDPYEGDLDYKYTIRGDILVLTLPEGDSLEFRRVKGGMKRETTAAKPRTEEPPGTRPSAGREDGGQNENHLLVGKFMSYSSASSSTGSSSWTQYVTFDGQGNFEWNSESAHSAQQYDQTGANTGWGVAGSTSGGNRGKYRVKGNSIFATFPDGSQGEGMVTELFQDGSIGAFKFEGKTYAR